jgi:lipoic acid synthetase
MAILLKEDAVPLATRGKPEWLTIRPPEGDAYPRLARILSRHRLHTVCQEAHCPNLSECWSGGTATFMVLGDTCTRACRFCAVKTAYPAPAPDPEEPRKLAEAVRDLGLDYIVVTSVDRDDLPDQGAGHFAACIRELRERAPDVLVEVLTPDFQGREDLVREVVRAGPHVFGHNLETVRRLQRRVRDPRANYEQSLEVLRVAKRANPEVHTKSSLMLGLGETREEVLQAMRDLRAAGADFLTLGQYLRPTAWHLEVQEYVPPARFEEFERDALAAGFLYCAAGPFVRSSYRAGEFFLKSLVVKRARE